MTCIGVLDSGIGGLSVLREIQQLLPHENLLYVADQAHLPYGTRPLDEVREFSEGITRFMLAQNAKLVVIACNTASAAALYDLRETFPDMPFVGMEPAVRPAARDTRTGIIGVIATKATFQGRLYASLIDRFANGLEVITRDCPELVLLAERGMPYTESDYADVSDLLADFREAHADQLVLGCTHFAFVKPLIAAAMGEDAAIIDPAPAVAQQVQRVLTQYDILNKSSQQETISLLTTDDLSTFKRQIENLPGDIQGEIAHLRWQDKTLDFDSAG